MAKLPLEITATLNQLRQQLIDLIDDATATEYTIFERYGETERTLIVLEELKSVSQSASSEYSQLCNLQLRVAESQPIPAPDMLELLYRVIARIQNRIPALYRSVEEIRLEWNLL